MDVVRYWSSAIGGDSLRPKKLACYSSLLYCWENNSLSEDSRLSSYTLTRAVGIRFSVAISILPYRSLSILTLLNLSIGLSLWLYSLVLSEIVSSVSIPTLSGCIDFFSWFSSSELRSLTSPIGYCWLRWACVTRRACNFSNRFVLHSSLFDEASLELHPESSSASSIGTSLSGNVDFVPCLKFLIENSGLGLLIVVSELSDPC